MKILKIFIILFLSISFSNLNSDEKNAELKNKILKNIRCLICQGQSVYDSESEFASSIKLIVDRKINAGLKEERIYEFLRKKYGDWIIYNPQLNKNTYVLWLLPLLLFLFGGTIIYKKISKKKMNNNSYNKILLVLISVLCFFAANADEYKNDITMHKYDFYAGTFDTIDKKKKEKANLYGFEHNNPILFKDTFVGKFSPISGMIITDKKSIYLYTGVQAQYEMGSLKILPSFAPGYYERGNGKDLGSVLEFKSEFKLAYDVIENTQVGFSYSHISNNEWGKGGKNPGVDNKTISFSKVF